MTTPSLDRYTLERAAAICMKPRIWDASRGMVSVVAQCREAADELLALAATIQQPQASEAAVGPYVPPVVYDPQRGYLIDSKTGARFEPKATKSVKPWHNAPETDAIWKRHTEDAAASEDRSKELDQYYEMASHACEMERQRNALRASGSVPGGAQESAIDHFAGAGNKVHEILATLPQEPAVPEGMRLIPEDEYEALRQIQFYARQGGSHDHMVVRFIRELDAAEYRVSRAAAPASGKEEK